MERYSGSYEFSQCSVGPSSRRSRRALEALLLNLVAIFDINDSMIMSRIGRIGRGRLSRWKLFERCNKPFCTAKTTTLTTKTNAETSDQYTPGFFSRNPAITLGGIALGIGIYLYRNAHNRRTFATVQEPFTENAVISPYEAWELRSKNNLTYDHSAYFFPSDSDAFIEKPISSDLLRKSFDLFRLELLQLKNWINSPHRSF